MTNTKIDYYLYIEFDQTLINIKLCLIIVLHMCINVCNILLIISFIIVGIDLHQRIFIELIFTYFFCFKNNLQTENFT